MSDTFRNSSEWKKGGKVQDVARVAKMGSEGKRIVQSFSGHERNHLFLNVGGKQFEDISALSGLDNEADSRAFALWDFDHDGWQDIAMVNSNYPLLNLYRNQVATNVPDRASITIRLRGGNQKAEASERWSNRDGYGSEVTVVCGNRKYVRELRCGEGFAAQNSASLVVGIGLARQADRVDVRWPSGILQSVKNVPAGHQLTIYENPQDSPHAPEPHGTRALQATTIPADPPGEFARLKINRPGKEAPEIGNAYQLFVTTATWCPACKRNLPQIAALKQMLGQDVEIYGLPIDPKDDQNKLAAYVDKYQPNYQMLSEIAGEDRPKIAATVRKILDSDALPASILTDPKGRFIDATVGVPSISWVTKNITKRRIDSPR